MKYKFYVEFGLLYINRKQGNFKFFQYDKNDNEKLTQPNIAIVFDYLDKQWISGSRVHSFGYYLNEAQAIEQQPS